VKSPKIYFYDTGLACYLLRIISVDQLSEHYLRGGLFESFILSDMKKHFYNKGEEPPLYFWRDNHQNEIDCIIDYGTKLVPVEIKSSKTFNERFFEKLGYYSEIARSDSRESSVVYGGDDEFALSKGRVVSWRNIEKIVK
jgi:predicted AAA+ superfamily ATPase